MEPLSSNHRIPLQQAIEMTKRYRANMEGILKPEHQGKGILHLSETFDREAFDALLAQPGCTGIRIYYSMDQNLKFHAIVVGVNSQDQDILPSADTSTTDGTIVEEGRTCPPICTASPLNS